MKVPALVRHVNATFEVDLVMKKSLLESNPCLKDPERRRLLLRRSMISSFAIEGIAIDASDAGSVKEEDKPFTAATSPKSDQ